MEQKRLYRNKQNSVIAGVASGIADYFEIDPVITRILFVCLALFGGGGVLVYLVLWIVLPEKYPGYAHNDRTKESNQSTSADSDAEHSHTMNAQHQSSGHGSHDPHPSRGSVIAGVILITLGSLFLLERFIPHIHFGDLWPVLLVVIGVVLLATSVSGSNKQKDEE